MPMFTRSRSVARSPEQVFAVLDDRRQAPAWMPRIKSITVLTPDQPVGVGYSWRETSRLFGVLPVSVTLTVAEHDPPHRWGLVCDDGKTRARASFRLSPIDGGTHIEFNESVEDLQGRPKRAEAMLRRIERQDRDLLERLGGHLEATTRSDRPRAVAPAKKAKKAK
jgi:uncharacterized protein YndB with AHSA1/START domain